MRSAVVIALVCAACDSLGEEVHREADDNGCAPTPVPTCPNGDPAVVFDRFTEGPSCGNLGSSSLDYGASVTQSGCVLSLVAKEMNYNGTGGACHWKLPPISALIFNVKFGFGNERIPREGAWERAGFASSFLDRIQCRDSGNYVSRDHTWFRLARFGTGGIYEASLDGAAWTTCASSESPPSLSAFSAGVLCHRTQGFVCEGARVALSGGIFICPISARDPR